MYNPHCPTITTSANNAAGEDQGVSREFTYDSQRGQAVETERRGAGKVGA
jgi:hypothetical protein